MTCTDTSSPTRRAAAAPASVAALNAPTSPRTITVTNPAPMYSLPTRTTFAALTIASAASTEPINPRVSTIPSASSDILQDPSAGSRAAPPEGVPALATRANCVETCLNRAKANILQYQRQLRYDSALDSAVTPSTTCANVL